MGFPDARPIPLLASLSDWLANQKLLGTEVHTHNTDCKLLQQSRKKREWAAKILIVQ